MRRKAKKISTETIKASNRLKILCRSSELQGIPKIPGLRYIKSKQYPEYVIVTGCVKSITELKDILRKYA